MSISGQETPLFTLPLELRELIYEGVLSSPSHGPAILQTCREIHSEAKKFLFQRPLMFCGQIELYRWLSQASPRFLTYTKEISIGIQDVDMKPLLKLDTSGQPSSSERLLTWQLYDSEIDRLHRALEKLPKIRTITLRALPGRQSFLYREFLNKVLWMLGSLYPNLQDLKLEGNLQHQDLKFLSRLGQLQSFSFNGFSASSPMETGAILNSIETLTKLSLFSQSTMLASFNQPHGCFRAKRQPHTGDVVRTINELASFSVAERTPQPSSTPLFTPEVLASLHTHKTLKCLSVSLSQAADSETLVSLGGFLGNSSIEELELDWPNLSPHDLETYTLLPYCLKALWVRVARAADAFAILWSISESREGGDLRAMRKIVLVRSMSGCGSAVEDGIHGGDVEMNCSSDSGCYRSDDINDVNVTRARERLQSLGVRVYWCTEYF